MNHILISSDSQTDDEKAFYAEEAERKQWQRWAIYAAEVERNRRMAVLAELEEEETKERVRRQQWAIAAIETERQERIQEHFLEAMASSIWFADTISNMNLDYEVVCPYAHLGCAHVCLRTELAAHVDKECKFRNLDSVKNATSEQG
jgi:non-canonical poly(A) RNA polymerase PAPD5/7